MRAAPAVILPALMIGLDRLRQLQQAQRIADVAAALADDPGDVLVAVTVLARQRLIAAGLFQRIEIAALHVLDDGELERLAVGRFERHDRNVVQAGALRRPPAPLAGDDLVGILRPAHRPHHDRLDDAALLDRCRQVIELRLGEMPARIARIRLEIFDRHPPLIACALDVSSISPPTSPMSAASPRPSRDRPSSGIAMSLRRLRSRRAVRLVRIMCAFDVPFAPARSQSIPSRAR